MVVKRSRSEFSIFTVKTTTGSDRNDIPVSDIKWGLRVNTYGELDITIPITATELEDTNIPEITTASHHSLCFAYRGKLIEGGTIVSSGMDLATNTYKVTATGIWNHLRGVRMFSPDFNPEVEGAQPMKDKYTLSGLTLGGIADAIVHNAINSPRRNAFIPIEVTNPNEVGTHERTWWGFDKNTVGDELEALTKVQGGPDIRFQLAWANDEQSAVKWIMQRGTEANPLLMGTEDWLLDARVAKSTVVSLGVTMDGSSIGTTAWAEGNGEGLDKGVGWATNAALLDAGYPLRDISTDAKQIDDASVLAGYALQRLREGSGSTQTWTCTVSVAGFGGTPSLDAVMPGQFAQIYIPKNHPAIRSATYITRIMAVDGDGSDKMKLTLEPFLGDDGIYDPNKVPRRWNNPLKIDDSKNDKTPLHSSIPLDGGGQFKVDKNGMGIYDANGNLLGGFDAFGTGFGSMAGNGTGAGGVSSGTVVSYNAQDRTAVVNIDGRGNTTVKNGEATALHAGDLVWTAPAAKNGDPDVVVAAPKVATSNPGVFGPYGTSAGYPVDASVPERYLPYGASFIDTDNVFGFGDDALIIDSPLDNNVWVASTGARYTMLPPNGFSRLPGMLRVTNGQGYLWATAGSSYQDKVFLFQWNKTNRSWVLCNGLPDMEMGSAAANSLEGFWNSTSVGSEIFSEPVVVIQKIREQAFHGDATGWWVPLTVMIYRWNAIAATWNSWSFDIESPKGPAGTAIAPNYNTDNAVFNWGWSIMAGPHVFFRVKLDSTTVNNQYGLGDDLWYFNTLTGADPELLDSDFAYLGESMGAVGKYSGAATNSTIRLSADGLMYTGTPASNDQYKGKIDATLKRRALNSSAVSTKIVEPANMNNNTPVGVFYPQRVWETDRFIIAAQMFTLDTDGVTQRAWRGVLIDFNDGQGTSAHVVSPDAVLNGTTRAVVSVPIQSADGSVVANMDTSNATYVGLQGPSHKIYQVIIQG